MPTLRLSQRAVSTPSSPIRKLSPFADQAQNSGVHLIRLNIGQPDVEAPQAFFDGVHLFKDKILAYDPSAGSLELRKQWIKYLKRANQIDIPIDWMQITMGASEALIFSFMTCCDPGDEIIVFDPTYANYMGFAAISGVRLVPVPCELDDGFRLPQREIIERAFSNRTRAILLCNPNNPTGTVYSRQELLELLAICEENNIFLVVDETYREIVFDGISPLSALNLSPDNQRMIVIDSLSKRFSLCGARIGCMITANQAVRTAVFNIAQARLSAPTIEQFAAAHMLSTFDGAETEATRTLYQSRRDALITGLQGIPNIGSFTPTGAFYTVVRLPVPNAEDFCLYMLNTFRHNEESVFLAPAQGFFLDSEKGSDKVRIAFVLRENELKRACELVALGLASYLECHHL